MKITDIKTQIKDKERVSVFLDGEYSFSVLKEILVINRLVIGKEITREEIEPIICESENKSAFIKGINYISRKVCSEKMIRDYLLKKGYNENAVNYAALKLKEYRYINDEEYAKAYISCCGEAKGRLKTAYELKNKGINDDIINKFKNDDDKELQICIKTAQKFIKNKTDDNTLKQKLYRHLLYRGFSSNMALNAADKVLKDNNEDIDYDK